MESIEVFRTIKIPLKIEDEILEVEIPFTVELLQRVEKAIADGDGLPWFRRKRSEKSILNIFEDFCKPYLPPTLVERIPQTQPMFSALFFSHVRNALQRSIEECMTSMSDTQG